MFSGKKKLKIWHQLHHHHHHHSSFKQKDFCSRKKENEEKSGNDLEIINDEDESLKKLNTYQDNCKSHLQKLQDDYARLEETVKYLVPFKYKTHAFEKKISTLNKTIEKNQMKYSSTLTAVKEENERLQDEICRMRTTCGKCYICCSRIKIKPTSAADLTGITRNKAALLSRNEIGSNDSLKRLKKIEDEQSVIAQETSVQRQQYSECLEEISKEVYKALLSQKALRRDCTYLHERILTLEDQNRQLNDVIFRQQSRELSPPINDSFLKRYEGRDTPIWNVQTLPSSLEAFQSSDPKSPPSHFPFRPHSSNTSIIHFPKFSTEEISDDEEMQMVPSSLLSHDYIPKSMESFSERYQEFHAGFNPDIDDAVTFSHKRPNYGALSLKAKRELGDEHTSKNAQINYYGIDDTFDNSQNENTEDIIMPCSSKFCTSESTRESVQESTKESMKESMKESEEVGMKEQNSFLRFNRNQFKRASTFSLNDILDGDIDELKKSLECLENVRFSEKEKTRTEIETSQNSNTNNEVLNSIINSLNSRSSSSRPTAAAEKKPEIISNNQEGHCIADVGSNGSSSGNSSITNSSESTAAPRNKNNRKQKHSRNHSTSNVVHKPRTTMHDVFHIITQPSKIITSPKQRHRKNDPHQSHLDKKDTLNGTILNQVQCLPENIDACAIVTNDQKHGHRCEDFLEIMKYEREESNTSRELKEQNGCNINHHINLDECNSVIFETILKELPDDVMSVISKDKVSALTAFFEDVHAEQCPDCQQNSDKCFSRFVRSRRNTFDSRDSSFEESSRQCSAEGHDDPKIQKTVSQNQIAAAEIKTLDMAEEREWEIEGENSETEKQFQVLNEDMFETSPLKLTTSKSLSFREVPDDSTRLTAGSGLLEKRGHYTSMPTVSHDSRFQVAYIRTHSLRSFSDILTPPSSPKQNDQREIVNPSDQSNLQDQPKDLPREHLKTILNFIDFPEETHYIRDYPQVQVQSPTEVYKQVLVHPEIQVYQRVLGQTLKDQGHPQLPDNPHSDVAGYRASNLQVHAQGQGEPDHISAIYVRKKHSISEYDQNPICYQSIVTNINSMGPTVSSSSLSSSPFPLASEKLVSNSKTVSHSSSCDLLCKISPAKVNADRLNRPMDECKTKTLSKEDIKKYLLNINNEQGQRFSEELDQRMMDDLGIKADEKTISKKPPLPPLKQRNNELFWEEDSEPLPKGNCEYFHQQPYSDAAIESTYKPNVRYESSSMKEPLTDDHKVLRWNLTAVSSSNQQNSFHPSAMPKNIREIAKSDSFTTSQSPFINSNYGDRKKEWNKHLPVNQDMKIEKEKWRKKRIANDIIQANKSCEEENVTLYHRHDAENDIENNLFFTTPDNNPVAKDTSLTKTRPFQSQFYMPQNLYNNHPNKTGHALNMKNMYCNEDDDYQRVFVSENYTTSHHLKSPGQLLKGSHFDGSLELDFYAQTDDDDDLAFFEISKQIENLQHTVNEMQKKQTTNT